MKFSANREILALDDLALVAWRAIEPIWDALPYANPDELDRFLSDLTEGQRALIAIDWCQKEIRNGGLEQLICNGTGNLLPYAIPGFNLIGAPEYALILAEAKSFLGHSYPRTVAARRRALTQLSKTDMLRLRKLDDDFLDLLHSHEHDLEMYRGRFVKQNPDCFIEG